MSLYCKSGCKELYFDPDPLLGKFSPAQSCLGSRGLRGSQARKSQKIHDRLSLFLDGAILAALELSITTDAQTYSAHLGVELSSERAVNPQICIRLTDQQEHVGDSPYTIRVAAGPPCLKKFVVEGSGRRCAAAGRIAVFTVVAHDAWGNVCEATQLPKGLQV